MSEQLTLSVDLHESARFDNFLETGNLELVQALDLAGHGRGEPFIYCWGPEGAGKSHLLQAVCHAANNLSLAPVYLPLKNLVSHTPAVLDDLEKLQLVCIDDVDAIAGRPDWEEAFFHFFNRMHDAKKRLIVTGRVAPTSLGLALPDLVSRLSWGVVYQVNVLSDEGKMQALKLRAKHRGIELPDPVLDFMLRHWPRDMGSLFSAFEKLTHASLVQQRKLTVPFVKQILKT
jgi:DnaA-homolog protein